MPTTPVFGFPYPSPYTPVNVTQFGNMAINIDTAVQNEYNTLTTARTKPIATLANGNGAISAGATVAVTWASASWDPGGMFNVGSPTVLTAPAGVYHVNATARLGTGTITSVLIQVIINGSPSQVARRVDMGLAGSVQPFANCSGHIFLPTGSTVGLSVTMTGSGLSNILNGALQIMWVADANPSV